MVMTSARASKDPKASPGHVGRFASFPELFDAARPRLEKEKALVAAYWLQICQTTDALNAQAINSELKHLGHGLSNVTEALSSLIAEKPALILQIRKSGSSKQARKLYKLSEAGRRRVLEMIPGAIQGVE